VSQKSTCQKQIIIGAAIPPTPQGRGFPCRKDHETSISSEKRMKEPIKPKKRITVRKDKTIVSGYEEIPAQNVLAEIEVLGRRNVKFEVCLRSSDGNWGCGNYDCSCIPYLSISWDEEIDNEDYEKQMKKYLAKMRKFDKQVKEEPR
jgi:hypothetical protein